MRRSGFVVAAGFLGAAAAVACQDGLPSAPGPQRAARPRLNTTSDLTGFAGAVEDAFSERIPSLQPTSLSATPLGGSGQAAVLSSSRADFPLEGSRYLVVSSGQASDFARDEPAVKSTTYPTACTADGRCDAGGVDLTLGLPAGATSVEVSFRYYTWDVAPKADPFRIYVVSGHSATLVSEATIQSEFGAAASAVGELRYGPASQTVSINVAGLSSVTLRFEAADSPDAASASGSGGGFDSGALIDNIRVLTSGSADRAAPLVSETMLNPTPVPYSEASTLTSRIDDGGIRGGSFIAAAEYRINDSAYRSMGTASAYSFNALTGLYAETSIAGSATPVITVRTVCVRGEDALGNTARPDCVEQAVYDPAQGFVTGSGSFESGQGAYGDPADPNYRRSDYDVVGRAQFGFSSRYKLGSNTPTGTTRFTFRAGGLEFNSTVYQYLIVDRAHARYKGRGKLTVNNQPVFVDGVAIDGDQAYGFIVSATDGALMPTPTSDKIRIKIWRITDGIVVYDNQRQYASTNTDQSESAVAVTAISNGRIMIKK